jgi:hypothetical protein
MNKFIRYNQFLNESKKGEFYKIILSDIVVNVDVIIDALKKEFNMNTWFQYDSPISITLGYYSSSDDSYENIMKMKKFLHEKLIYFRNLECYDDDKRIVLRFVEPGDPKIKFKFHY